MKVHIHIGGSSKWSCFGSRTGSLGEVLQTNSAEWSLTGQKVHTEIQIFPGYAQQVSYCRPDVSGFCRTRLKSMVLQMCIPKMDVSHSLLIPVIIHISYIPVFPILTVSIESINAESTNILLIIESK